MKFTLSTLLVLCLAVWHAHAQTPISSVPSTNLLKQTDAVALYSWDGSGYRVKRVSLAALLAEKGDRVAVNTLHKKNTGRGRNILWVGDSLVASYAVSVPHLYFQTNLLANEGTNGWWGGYGLGWNPLSTDTAKLGTMTPLPDAFGPWIEAVRILTNDTSVIFSATYGDGFFDADRAGIVWVQTNAFGGGTLTVKTVDDGGNTNTLDEIACDGTPRLAFGTNYSFTAGRYKLLLEATAGNGFFATPGIWSSTNSGIRYGAIGAGGLTYWTNANWRQCLTAYAPDAIFFHEANAPATGQTLSDLIRDLQTNLPNVDVYIVGVQPWQGDYLAAGGELDVASNANQLWQLFAQTNKNTAYFPTVYVFGNGRSWPTLTNLGIADTIHPISTNPTLGNVMGKQLLRFTGLDPDPLFSVSESTPLPSNILTNHDLRGIHFNGGGLTPLVVDGLINATGTTAGFTYPRLDNGNIFTRQMSQGSQVVKFGTSEAHNYAPDYGLGAIVVSNSSSVIRWDVEVRASNNWAGFEVGRGGLPTYYGHGQNLRTVRPGDTFVPHRDWKFVVNATVSTLTGESPAPVSFYDWIRFDDSVNNAIVRRSVPHGYGWKTATYTLWVQATNAAAATYPFYSEAISYTSSARTYTLSSVHNVELTNGLNVITIVETWPNDTDLREVGIILANNTNNSSLWLGSLREVWSP